MADKVDKHKQFEKNLDSSSDFYKGKTIKGTLNDKAELNYYIDKLNKKLRQKDPENYDKLVKEYGYNPNKPSTTNTRVAGAEYYVNKQGGRNFDKSLGVDEQKDILGEDYDKYVDLKKTYGKDLKLFGANEDSNKPETWKVGARHVVATNPVYWESKLPNPITGKIDLDYGRTVTYDPTQKDPYLNSDTNLLSQDKKPQQYTRTVSRIYREENKGTTTNNDGKVVWTDKQKNPMNFYMEYDDGSKRQIHEGEYRKWIGVNGAPSDIKAQYGTETVNINDLPDKEKEIAKARLDAQTNKQDQ
jgi:hypothetical protein